ncbi:class II aldolase (plasmid) [Burkholderia humptydooensis]|uniref:Class II aldolase n=1 Tax=Burkholderia humptydooensis TaxID=430531 RepID=A0A7U4P818_9BURK|nr:MULTISPECIES: class II aldolase/adducin family protein [Burkholderia]AJY38123.1 hypothetical protein BW21_6390 [Burkholderia sp. 2002721687]ALX44607.1 aldolase [Burkholderia humptydooensis]QPS42010.1 class II aldolase [Burkholderia humptydooensis]
MNERSSPCDSLSALCEASARLGADPSLIQAAGGNTSLKDGDTLWVKASGLRLRDALRRPMFVPVALDAVRRGVAAQTADPVGPALLRERAAEGLRPSIETTLHALMPHSAVLHVHAVDAIAWAVQPDAPVHLAGLLACERWAWVPYERPGLPLTLAVARITASVAVDVLVLGSHGLVVGGDTVADAERRLARVVGLLRRPVRAAPQPDLAALEADASGTGWRLPLHARAHAVATDVLNLSRARCGVLYPDHVVFLGIGLESLSEGAEGLALRSALVQRRGGAEAPPCLALPGRGMLVRDDVGEAAEELLACWADVLVRLPESPEPVYLADEEARSLADWEAEKFRLQQAR